MSQVSKRDRAVDSATIWSIDRMRVTGSPLACWSALSIDGAATNGGVAVRTIHTIGNSRTFRVVTPSDSYTIGTYITDLTGRVSPLSRTLPTMPTIWRSGS